MRVYRGKGGHLADEGAPRGTPCACQICRTPPLTIPYAVNRPGEQ